MIVFFTLKYTQPSTLPASNQLPGIIFLHTLEAESVCTHSFLPYSKKVESEVVCSWGIHRAVVQRLVSVGMINRANGKKACCCIAYCVLLMPFHVQSERWGTPPRLPGEQNSQGHLLYCSYRALPRTPWLWMLDYNSAERLMASYITLHCTVSPCTTYYSSSHHAKKKAKSPFVILDLIALNKYAQLQDPRSCSVIMESLWKGCWRYGCD